MIRMRISVESVVLQAPQRPKKTATCHFGSPLAPAYPVVRKDRVHDGKDRLLDLAVTGGAAYQDLLPTAVHGDNIRLPEAVSFGGEEIFSFRGRIIERLDQRGRKEVYAEGVGPELVLDRGPELTDLPGLVHVSGAPLIVDGVLIVGRVARLLTVAHTKCAVLAQVTDVALD